MPELPAPGILAVAVSLAFSIPATTPEIPACDYFSPGERRVDHGTGTPYTAFHGDRPGRTIFHACTAFHAIPGTLEGRNIPVVCKDPVGADLAAAPAPGATFGIEPQRGFRVGIEYGHRYHHPARIPAPTAIAQHSPMIADPAITGMYRKISFLTPLLDVNGVDPVKFRAR